MALAMMSIWSVMTIGDSLRNRADATNFTGGPTWVWSSQCWNNLEVNTGNNGEDYVYYDQLTTATRNALDATRAQDWEPTDLHTYRTYDATTPDVRAIDQDYTTQCGLTWDGDLVDYHGLTTCHEINAAGECNRQMIRFDTGDYGYLVADHGASAVQSLVCHEFGHSLGLKHVTGSESCMTSDYLFPTNASAHDRAHIDGHYNPNHLQPGELLPVDQFLHSSNEAWLLKFQSDGNLVVYQAPCICNPIWALSWCYATVAGSTAVMQGDGNFVVYRPGLAPWATGTGPAYPGSRMILGNDGNFVVETSAGGTVWQSVAHARVHQ